MNKPSKVIITAVFGMNTIRLKFSEGGSIYVAPAELTEPAHSKGYTTYINDLTYQGIAQTYRLAICNFPSSGREEGKVDCEMFLYYMDVGHFFRTLLWQWNRIATLRAAWKADGKDDWKFKDPTLTFQLAKFREKVKRPPLLSVTQMLHHPNVKSDWPDDNARFVKTLASFRKASPSKEAWQEFIERLSHYIDCASVRGDGDEEFYFDGRKVSKTGRACGFNGAFIKREKDEHGYSIHT